MAVKGRAAKPSDEANLALLSLSQLAKLAGMDRRTARARIDAAGLKPTRGAGRTLLYEAPKALKALFRSDVIDFSEESARLKREQTKAQAMRNAVAEGQHLERADVIRTWATHNSVLKNRIRGIPKRSVSRISGYTHAMAREQLGMIDQVLNDLACDGLPDQSGGERVEGIR